MGSSDMELAVRIVQGDEEAFNFFYTRYERDIKRQINGMIGDRFEAEDLAQEVFFKAFRAMASYSGDAPLRNWLKKIALNVCIDRLRKRRVKTVPWPTVRRKEGDEESLEMPDTGLSCLDQVLVKESDELTLVNVSRLPRYYREVVILHDLMGYSREEISKRLSCPLGTIKSRLFRAHAMLARFIENDGETESKVTSSFKTCSNVKSSSGNILYREKVAV